ncbi:flagellar hook-associated protein FlgK [Dryocola sp. BD626]|uniref:flagellar hook-associated protein FlgK n=1 Tax=Dryocola sp. BD626 TaxID=3133273 RepID=UPI003F509758
MNLFNLAKSGLSTAQSALSVVGSNLTNGMTPGYSRRDIILGEAGGLATGKGFYGYGVQVNGVQRGYDAFINNQLRGASNTMAGITSRYEQLSEIDNMLGDSESNPSVALNGFFGAMKTLSDDPSLPSSRQAAFRKLDSLTYQFNTSSKRLTGLEQSTNTKIKQSVDVINNSTEQLARLNMQIEKITAQGGTPPSDLLDTRDGLLRQLSEHIGIEVNENIETGRVDVKLADGRALVSGETAYKMQASTSPADPNKTIVSYVDANGVAKPLNEERITGGVLGGLFKFRNEDLTHARNEINQIALQMASRFNEVNRNGFDQNGQPGGDLFTIPDPKAIANTNNGGDAALTPKFNGNIGQVNAEDYSITFDGTSWQVKGADGRNVPYTTDPTGKLVFDGVEIEVSGTPQAGDSFVMNPAAGVAESLDVAIASGEEIAASDSNDPTDAKNNVNLLELLKIQDEKLLGGKATLTDAYATLVGSVGSSMNALKVDGDASSSVLQELEYKWQATSGVDLNEEVMNLQMFTQYYQANAQILQAATTLFDTLLTLK